MRENWMQFFVTGIAETAEQAVATARELIAMFDAHRQEVAGVDRGAPSTPRVHELMQAHPIVTIQQTTGYRGPAFRLRVRGSEIGR